MTTPRTQLCAVIGHPIQHSLSPALHTAAFAAAHIDATCVAIDVPPRRLAAMIQAVRTLGIRQVAVTLPHKQAVMAHLDRIDASARAIGAVNTIINRHGALVGYNTDSDGVEQAMAGTRLKGKRAAVLGAGGAARAVVHVLKKHGAEITVFNRTRSRLGHHSRTYAHIDEIQHADIIINTTPVGMAQAPRACLVPQRFLHRGQTVFDIIYTPRETELIRRALETGCRTITGDVMFLSQAAKQFELWTAKPAPRGAMRQALAELIHS